MTGRKVNCMDYTQLKQKEKELNSLIRRSKNACERNDNSKEILYAQRLAEEVKKLNPDVVVDWPGLYPDFKLDGIEYYSVESLFNAMFKIN